MAPEHETAPRVGEVQARDGTKIFYQWFRKDRQAEHCVVLLHSLAMDHGFWREVAPALARHADVVCLDVRGHGQSGKPAGPYSIAQFAADARDVVQALGYERVVVGGASMGGCIALQFAIDHPGLVAGLALIDTTAWYGPTAEADWAGRADKAAEEGFQALVPFQATRWFSEAFRGAQPHVVQACIDTFLANDLPAYRATCHAMGSFDARDGAARVATPTVVVVGEEDYAAPVAMAEQLRDLIAEAELTVIPAARHLTPLESPEVIIETFKRLLAAAPKAAS